MIFFRRAAKAQQVEAQTARAPEGVRIYAIGDVHGRADLLAQLAQIISDDLARSPVERVITVFLGDYVDRGPGSAAVLERLAAADFPTAIATLRGNHEATMLQFLQDPDVLENWRQYGGLETLASYGVNVREIMRGRGFDAAREALWQAMPKAHHDFLNGTLMSWSAGDYFFAHAGVKPHVPLETQDERDLLWIRDEFLSFRGSFDGKVVVHGHTPMDAPELLANRINVDTGAYATGVLTCVALDGAERRILST